jgi:hypothetical protein
LAEALALKPLAARSARRMPALKDDTQAWVPMVSISMPAPIASEMRSKVGAIWLRKSAHLPARKRISRSRIASTFRAQRPEAVEEGRRRRLDAAPDRAGDVAQQFERVAEAAGALHEVAELVDELAGADDQRADAGADDRAV